MKHLVLFLVAIVLVFGADEQKKSGPFVPNGLLDSIDWNRFHQEFHIGSNHIRTNCKNDILRGESPIGIDAHMIEPAIIAEMTRDKWKIEAIGMQLDIGDNLKNITETGKSRGKEGFAYNHIIQFPIMSIVLGDMLSGVFCFEEPTIGIIYMSELDPSNSFSVYRLKMMPVIASFLSEQGVVNSIASCVASQSYDALSHSDKRKGRAGKSFRDIMDGFVYVNGCKGLVPIGGFINSEDPFAAALNMSVGNMQMISQASPLLKQTVRSVINQYSEDLWCRPKYGPNIMAMSQYAAQLVRPTSGKVMELGVATPTQTHFKNKPVSGDNSVWLLWQRRDYSMFAYQCGKKNKGK